MATYLELRKLIVDEDLPNKVQMATVVYAEGLISGTPTLADQNYAAAVFSSPRSESTKVLMAVLAANKALTVAQIQGASDAAIQTQVDAIAPNLRDVLAGV